MPGASLLDQWRLLHAVLADADLSPSAKVVMGRLLFHFNSKTGQCSPSYETLARGTGMTRRNAMRAVRELRDLGWVGREHTTREGNRSHLANAFALNFDRALTIDEVVTERSPSGGDETVTRGGDRAVTTLVTEQSPGVVTKRSPKHGKIEHGKGTSESSSSQSRFDEWWKAYPRKVGKDAAKPVFERIVSNGKATADELIAGAVRYAAERDGQEQQFTKHPKTWLNGGHWADEALSPYGGKGNSRNSNGRGQAAGFSATQGWLPERLGSDD